MLEIIRVEVLTEVIIKRTYIYMGAAVAQLVKALRYKPEGRDSRRCH
jgi:hypothetical protein